MDWGNPFVVKGVVLCLMCTEAFAWFTDFTYGWMVLRLLDHYYSILTDIPVFIPRVPRGLHTIMCYWIKSVSHQMISRNLFILSLMCTKGVQLPSLLLLQFAMHIWQLLK